MNLLRVYIRETLRESRFKQMSKPKFTGLKQALANSSFLDADPESDLDGEDEEWSSEAAEALRDTLNDYFDAKFGQGMLTAVIKVRDSESADITKDDVLKRAAYDFSGGSHVIEIVMTSIEPDVGIIGDDTSPVIHRTFRDIAGVPQKAYEVIMHELAHMQQFLKFSQGKPTVEKWDQFMAEYNKRGGSSGMGPDYFFFDEEGSASELETFSLQMAHELVDALGKDEAVRVLQQQHPDHSIIRDNSSTFRIIDQRSDVTRPEFREMLKRAKQYAKRIEGRA